MANKPPFYYTKCPFWPQNLIFGTTGSLEQFENFMKKHLNSLQTLKRNTKCFWISIKSEIKVSSAFGVAIKCWWWGLPISCGVTCYPGFVVTRAPRSKIQEKIIPGLFLWFLFLAHGVTCYPVTLGCKSRRVRILSLKLTKVYLLLRLIRWHNSNEPGKARYPRCCSIKIVGPWNKRLAKH